MLVYKFLILLISTNLFESNMIDSPQCPAARMKALRDRKSSFSSVGKLLHITKKLPIISQPALSGDVSMVQFKFAQRFELLMFTNVVL